VLYTIIILFYFNLLSFLSFRGTRYTIHAGIHGTFFWTTPRTSFLLTCGECLRFVFHQWVCFCYLSFLFLRLLYCVYVFCLHVTSLLFYFVLFLLSKIFFKGNTKGTNLSITQFIHNHWIFSDMPHYHTSDERKKIEILWKK
jgi:hypothetical protein